MQTDLRIIAFRDTVTGNTWEELSLFVDVHDPDGVEDVAWVVVEFPDLGFGWHLEDSGLVYRNRGEQHWFGAAGLRVRGLSDFPRGALLRITVGDLGGRSTERTMRIPVSAPTSREVEFPRITDEGSLIPAPGALRHFLRIGGDVYEVAISSSEKAVSLVSEQGSIVPDDADQGFTVIAEMSDYVWVESGPWFVGE